MRQLAIDDVRADLRISVRVAAEASIGLHKIVIHHPQHTKSSVAVVGVLSEREMESRHKPVLVSPSWIGLIRLVSEPGGIGLTHLQLRLWNFSQHAY